MEKSLCSCHAVFVSVLYRESQLGLYKFLDKMLYQIVNANHFCSPRMCLCRYCKSVCQSLQDKLFESSSLSLFSMI